MCPLCSDLPEEPVVSCCGHVFCKACVSLQQSAAPDSTHPCATCAVPLSAADVWTAAALRAAAAAAGEASGGGVGGGSETGGAKHAAGGGAGNIGALREILGGESSWGGRLSSKTRRVVQLLRAMRGMSEEWDEDGPLPDVIGGKAGAGTGGKGRGKGAAKGATVGSSAAEKAALNKKTKEEREELRMRAAVDEHRISNSDGALAKALPPLSAVPQRLDTSHGVPEKKVPDKAIVFSQWTAMLDVLEMPLRRAGLIFRRLVRPTLRTAHQFPLRQSTACLF
jgi:hypothetical protein